MTNFERIKAMSVEELAKTFDDAHMHSPFCLNWKNCKEDDLCVECIIEWLQKESEVQDG